MLINDYILKIKRAESPGYARLKKLQRYFWPFNSRYHALSTPSIGS